MFGNDNGSSGSGSSGSGSGSSGSGGLGGMLPSSIPNPFSSDSAPPEPISSGPDSGFSLPSLSSFNSGSVDSFLSGSSEFLNSNSMVAKFSFSDSGAARLHHYIAFRHQHRWNISGTRHKTHARERAH